MCYILLTSSFLSLITTAGTSRKGEIGTPLLLPSFKNVHCRYVTRDGDNTLLTSYHAQDINNLYSCTVYQMSHVIKPNLVFLTVTFTSSDESVVACQPAVKSPKAEPVLGA